MRYDRDQEESNGPVFYLGLSLILFGSMALIYLAISAVQILKDPGEANIIQWLLTTVAENEVVMSGHFGEQDFEIQASEPFQYMFLCVLGLMVFSFLSAIFSALLRGGVQLVKVSNRSHKSHGKNA